MSPNETRELDRRAQAQGFPSHSAMIGWYRNRSNSLRGRGNSAGGGNPLAAVGRSINDGLSAAAQSHPANIFNWIAGKLGSINDRNRRR